MDDDWLEANVAPELTGVAERPWTAETLSGFVARLDDRIKAAVASGELSREGARTARDRIGAAMKTVPGVTSTTASAEVTTTVKPVGRRAR